jgi:hypothetical protein
MFFKVSVVGMAISFQNDTILVPFRHQGQVGKTVGKQRGSAVGCANLICAPKEAGTVRNAWRCTPYGC